jgi:hypothetical protein
MKTFHPEEAHVPESTQNVFDTGHKVGDYAMAYFGKFVEILVDFNNFNESFKLALEETKSLINEKYPTICEAAFKFENAMCFADIVRVNADGTLEIIEVKQTARVKPEHLDDMAFQYYVIKNCGYTISKISLMHIDTSYVRQGEIDPQKFFKIVDCTEEVLARQKDIPDRIENMLMYSELPKEPQMKVGDQCSNPYKCAFWEHCHPKVETSDETISESKNSEINIVKFNKKAIKDFLSQIEYPLYHFDFETTCQEPIPPVDGARPYHPTPFQYSLHIQKSKEDTENPEHVECLKEELTNQSVRELAEQLCKDIPKDVMLVGYNQSFEQRCIKQLANTFPDLADHLMAIHDNFIDLLKPFRSKYLQTEEMEGSASLKSVLPALVPDLSYDALEVQNGEMAYNTFKTLPSLSPEDKDKALQDMLAYCKTDTLAMVKILKKLEEMV